MRVLRNSTAFLVIGLFSFVAAAQSPSAIVGGPTVGFVQDEKGTTIWPFLGVLGSSVVGQRLELSAAITQTTIAPNQKFGIAVRVEDATPVLVSLDIVNPEIVGLNGVRPNPE